MRPSRANRKRKATLGLAALGSYLLGATLATFLGVYYLVNMFDGAQALALPIAAATAVLFLAMSLMLFSLR
jgi:hypothetical protein